MGTQSCHKQTSEEHDFEIRYPRDDDTENSRVWTRHSGLHCQRLQRHLEVLRQKGRSQVLRHGTVGPGRPTRIQAGAHGAFKLGTCSWREGNWWSLRRTRVEEG